MVSLLLDAGLLKDAVLGLGLWFVSFAGVALQPDQTRSAFLSPCSEFIRRLEVKAGRRVLGSRLRTNGADVPVTCAPRPPEKHRRPDLLIVSE